MAEVIAISALLWKAAEFLPQIRDGLYKGSAELDEFPIKVALLRAKHAQLTGLLQKFGMTEDEHLKPLVKAAVQILDKEQDYATRLQKSRFRRLRRRAFPGKLNGILSSLVDTVDASHQLLKTRVETNDLLVRSLGQTPCPLPFRPDRKYVPLLGSITEVQKALEDADGPCVVTVHGGTGMGKSSMAKYLAPHYQQLRRQQMVSRPPTTLYFPDGVFYLYCGRGAQARVKQLQMNLLESLGGGFGSSSQSNGCTSAPEEEGEFVHLPSHDTKLRFCLAKQKSLVILDDVWEVEVMEKLLVPGENVKYLVTSQISTICSDATLIELKSPNKAEARKILANYTQGLPTKGEFPNRIQSLTDAIIKELQYHPLSLANIGTSINRSRATDLGEWRAVKDSLWECDDLDENDVCISPLVYGSRYPLTLRASMMLMVDSLRPEARHLLFLTGLMEGPDIPEVLVKFFLKQIQPTGWRNKYRRDIKYLEDRSLVEYRCHAAYDYATDQARISRAVLVTHGLRIYYIRRNHAVDVTGIATEIFSGGSGSNNDNGEQVVQSGCTDEALATIMGAMYIEKPFRDVVATKLESQIRIFSGVVIPRSINYDVDALDLMDRAQGLKYDLGSLVWLLNPDGEGGWKQQAHEYAKKVMIRLTFRKELDDESMARLIQLPYTTTAACKALKCIIISSLGGALEDAFVNQNIKFSNAHCQTMKSLNDVCYNLHDNVAATNRCAESGMLYGGQKKKNLCEMCYMRVKITWGQTYCPRCNILLVAFEVLGYILLYESDNTILSIAKKWVEILAEDSNPTLQNAVANAIYRMYSSRALILVGEFPGFLDHLLMLIGNRNDSNVIRGAMGAIYKLCEINTMASKIGAIPGALETLFKKFLSEKDFCLGSVGSALCRISCIPEIRVQFIVVVSDSLEHLTNMLKSNPKSRKVDFRDLVSGAVEILANLSMENDFRKTIFVTFPKVIESLQHLHLSCFGNYDGSPEISIYKINSISRAMTILDPLQANPYITSNPIPSLEACFEGYMGRVQAYRQMQMYSEALEALKVAHEYHKQTDEMNSWCRMTELSRYGIFFKAMLEDYAGAMVDANSAIENYPNEDKKRYGSRDYGSILAERGVLKQLVGVNLAGALVDLDEALQFLGRSTYRSGTYGCLTHRGLVKHMMGDEVGARADAESALQLKFCWKWYERIDDPMGPGYLIELPVNYLGFSL